MLQLSTTLKHYKRKDIQKEMLLASKDREIAVKYGSRGFGKRPEQLFYAKDILEFAKKRATSFHVSEERWKNINALSPELKKEALNKLRLGWDLVLDIDSPNFRLSKIIAWLIINSLKEHGIKSISIKFSGNKGFHIGVPFECFPGYVNGRRIEEVFPEGPRRIALYLIDYIAKRHIRLTSTNEVIFAGRFKASLRKLEEITGKSTILSYRCKACKKSIKQKAAEASRFLCTKCGFTAVSEKNILRCEKCGSIMLKKEQKSLCSCGSNEAEKRLNVAEILDIDTILIASRHLYRMPYSLHEKSGLCSVPFNPDKVLEFEKSLAKPEEISVNEEYRFLESKNAEKAEAKLLLTEAFDFDIEAVKSRIEERHYYGKNKAVEDFDIADAVPESFFPPCIKNILAGLEDGKKRSLFILINFLRSTGYGMQQIKDILYSWNKKNKEELREVIIKGQLSYRARQKAILPPNCSNKAYYKDIGICKPDSFCSRIKNPVNYAILKAKQNTGKRRGRKKLTEEQKEMRKRYRQKLRQMKESNEKKAYNI